MNATEAFDRPLVEIASALRDRFVRSRDLVGEALARIRRANPAVNAVVTHRPAAEAFAEAEAAARRLDARAPAGPLDGLPITVKDIFETAGIRTTFGALHHRDRVPTADSPIVARLRMGGAVVVAKTSTPEFGFSPETENLLIGRTSTPWDPGRTSGGSSGGEAALLAMGASVLGLGSDISGSLRTPAHFCGAASLKPTHGWIPLDGHLPALEPWQEALLAPGPLARTAADLAVGWSALTGRPVETRVPGALRVAVGALDDPKLHPRCREAVVRAEAALDEAGHRVERVEILPVLARAHDLWERILLADGGDVLREALEDGRPFNLPLELLRSRLGRSDRSSMLLVALAILGARRPTALEEIEVLRASLAADLASLLGPERVLLLPVTPAPAHRHWSFFASLAVFRYIRLANVLGTPVATVPIVRGRSSSELPAGVQIHGAAGCEDLVLAVGIEAERARA